MSSKTVVRSLHKRDSEEEYACMDTGVCTVWHDLMFLYILIESYALEGPR
jgi:hypothetical protein